MSEPHTDPPPVEAGPEYLTRTCVRLFRRSEMGHLDRPLSWVWDGYLARGYMTLLTGQWKVGKSTLVAALLARLGAGGELAGRAVNPGRAIVITEEEAGPWGRRMAAHGIGEQAASFAFNPFVLKPVPAQWTHLIDDLNERRRERPVDVVILDTLAALLPGNEESSAAAMTNALRPLRDLAANGVAVLVLHHPRKGATVAGQAARGTGALPAAVDTILEYSFAGRAVTENRRRRLRNWSRHAGAPADVVLELDAGGTGYAVVSETEVEADDEIGRILTDLVRAAPDLTAAEVRARWPTAVCPHRATVHDRLSELVAAGHLTRSGIGKPHDPYRYRLSAPEVVGTTTAEFTAA